MFIRVFVFLCVRKSESVRRQEIARVERVGSTPRGTEKEQREHLPPHQEQLFNPPRRGDAGMGGAAKGRKVAGTATLVCFSLSPAHLYSLFKLSPTLSLYPVGFTETGGVDFFFFHFSLSQIKFRKHQLSVHLQLDEIQANVLISCTGEIPMDVWMFMSFSVCIELSCNMPISILHCNTNYTF